MDTMAPKEVSPPKASGVVPLAPPSVPKEGPPQTTSSKELERTPSSSARSSGRGRALPTPASTSSRKPGQLDETYSTASQHSVDEMMDESMPPSDDDLVPSRGAYTFGVRCLVSSATTDPSHVGHHTRTQGAPALAVQRGPAPRTELKATQVSPEVLAVALQSPTPQQRQQLPLVSGGSAPAASRPRDRQGAPLAVSTPRCPPREKERESRPNSRGRASSKERHHAAPSTAEGRGRMELGDVQPSTSTAAPLSEGGRGRGVRPRTLTLPKPTQQASSQEVEARDEATEPSALSSDQDDMEWEISKTKKKTKKPAVLRGPPLSTASVETQTSLEDLSSPQGSPSELLKVTHTQSPSCSKGAVPSKEGTTPSQVSGAPSAALAGPSGRGRGLPPRASCSNQKPRRTEQPPPPKGPTLSPDEKMDESLPLSEDDQSLPETESLPLVSSEVVGRPKDTAKKKTIRRVEAPKAP
ncbi:hypothetical protein ISCGN_026971 [Ixodes scapularis]